MPEQNARIYATKGDKPTYHIETVHTNQGVVLCAGDTGELELCEEVLTDKVLLSDAVCQECVRRAAGWCILGRPEYKTVAHTILDPRVALIKKSIRVLKEQGRI